MIDIETQLPIHLLDLIDWNPKGEIHGVYKNGLISSLDYFDVRDRLKVWANPRAKGRYLVLNGNQRLPLIIDKIKLELICEHFGLDKEDEYAEDPSVQRLYRSKLKEIHIHPDNQKVLQNIDVKVMQTSIDVQIMQNMTQDDAKLFVAAWDRNHAKHDEAKLVNNIFDQINIDKNRISRMIRPEKAFIQPIPKSESVPNVSQPSPNIEGSYEKPGKPEKQAKTKSEETEDFGAWGAPPENEATAPQKAPLIPFTLSLTRDGYQEISNRILKLSSRIFRENRIKEALEELSTALGESPLDTDSIIVEIALLTLGKHKEAAE